MNNIVRSPSEALGEKAELEKYSNRIKLMVKGGKNLIDSEALALAQVSMATGLNPFIGEVWYIPGNGPMVGIAGARRLDNENAAKKGGYTWDVCDPVVPEEAGATEQEIPNVAAAFKVEIHDSTATEQYQKLFADTLAGLRAAGTKDPFAEAKEICGSKPVWVGYGYSLKTENSRMNKVQLARKRAHADALKKRLTIPFGASVADADSAPSFDADAEVLDVDADFPPDEPELSEAESVSQPTGEKQETLL